jgi:hypothetical protein
LGTSEEDLQGTITEVAEVMEEYGMELSEKKSKVVCLNGKTQEREWRAGEKIIREEKEVKYLGVRVIGGKNGGLKVLEDKIGGASRIEGMVKFAAKRSGSKFVVGREGWKSLVVPRLMYAAGAVNWKEVERQKLEKMQMAFGRWMWGFHKSVRNGIVHGESGWSSFEERESKAKLGYVNRVLKGGEDLVVGVGRASLMEMGMRSRWWKTVEKMAREQEMIELSNLITMRRLTCYGMEELGIDESYKEDIKRSIEIEIKEIERKEEMGKNFAE